MLLTRCQIDSVMFLMIVVISVHLVSPFNHFRLNQQLDVMRKSSFQGNIAPGLIDLMRNMFRKVVSENQVNERIKQFKARQRQKKFRQQLNLERKTGTSLLTHKDFLQPELGSEFSY